MNTLDTMRALASQGEIKDLAEGETIFKSGDSGDCMYGVLDGTVELSWADHSRHELIRSGEVFGAGALVTSEHRRFGDARALTPTRLLVMNREKFLFAVQETPMFAVELLASIDQRLRDLKNSNPS